MFSVNAWRSEHQDQVVFMEELPEPVKATIRQEANNRTLRGIEKTAVNGKSAYAAITRADREDTRTVIGEDGAVIGRSKADYDED